MDSRLKQILQFRQALGSLQEYTREFDVSKEFEEEDYLLAAAYSISTFDRYEPSDEQIYNDTNHLIHYTGLIGRIAEIEAKKVIEQRFKTKVNDPNLNLLKSLAKHERTPKKISDKTKFQTWDLNVKILGSHFKIDAKAHPLHGKEKRKTEGPFAKNPSKVTSEILYFLVRLENLKEDLTSNLFKVKSFGFMSSKDRKLFADDFKIGWKHAIPTIAFSNHFFRSDKDFGESFYKKTLNERPELIAYLTPYKEALDNSQFRFLRNVPKQWWAFFILQNEHYQKYFKDSIKLKKLEHLTNLINELEIRYQLYDLYAWRSKAINKIIMPEQPRLSEINVPKYKTPTVITTKKVEALSDYLCDDIVVYKLSKYVTCYQSLHDSDWTLVYNCKQKNENWTQILEVPDEFEYRLFSNLEPEIQNAFLKRYTILKDVA